MPRIKPLIPRKQKDSIRRKILALLDDAGITQGQLAEQTGLMCRETLCCKLADPNKFTVGELRMIARIFNVDLSEVI